MCSRSNRRPGRPGSRGWESNDRCPNPYLVQSQLLPVRRNDPSDQKPLAGAGIWSLVFYDVVFQGVSGPNRQGDELSGIGIQTTAIRCPDGLLFPYLFPPLHKIRTGIIETDVKKFIGPGGCYGHPPFFHLLTAMGTLRRFFVCHRYFFIFCLKFAVYHAYLCPSDKNRLPGEGGAHD